jgi:hypothetical protein
MLYILCGRHWERGALSICTKNNQIVTIFVVALKVEVVFLVLAFGQVYRGKVNKVGILVFLFPMHVHPLGQCYLNPQVEHCYHPPIRAARANR